MSEQLLNSFLDFRDSIIQKLPAILIGTIFLVCFIIIGKVLRSFARKRLKRHVEDQLLINFIGRSIFLIMVVFGVIIFLNQLGLGKAAGGLLAGAGVSAIIIGFAFKDIGENFLAGFFLAFSRPFGVGDIVKVESIKGVVKALNFRNTHIRTFNGKDIFVPNAMLIKSPLINYTRDGLLRHDFMVGLDYGDNIAEAGNVIVSTLKNEPRIEQEGELIPFIMLEEFGTSTVNLRIFYWVSSNNFSSSFAVLKTEVMDKVLRNLVKEGFSLPADIIELKIYQEGQPIPLHIKNNSKSDNTN